MLEPPSKQLLALLQKTELCTPRDLRRCRARVQRLTHDLPVFDSVWIDALLQARKVTPFQARLLDSRRADQLLVGPCLLLDRLGGGNRGETFLARHRSTRQTCMLKLVDAIAGFSTAEYSALESAIAKLEAVNHPCIVGPQVCDRLDDKLVMVSRFVSGPHLAELLVRRGRFPAEIVWEIGRQLLGGLAALHERGLVHGDIRIHNVRVNDRGLAVLVDAVIRPILEQDLTIHTSAAPERFDGIAPELIGTGQPPTPASDLYALGCLLWQLLAGRPPFPGGDPLAKIAAHQTRKIDDVREWAPDTPEQLALGIEALTRADSDQRPPSAAHVLKHWGMPGRLARGKVAKFVAGFRTAARRSTETRSTSVVGRWVPVFLIAFLLSGLVAFLADRGARSVMLKLAGEFAASPVVTKDGSPGSAITDGVIKPSDDLGLRQLPQPRSGLLELKSPGPYQATDLSVVGALEIRGLPGVRPQIRISNRPLKISAEQVRLKNVEFVKDDRSSKGAGRWPVGALVLVQADQLEIYDCKFETHPLAEYAEEDSSVAARLNQKPIGVGWRNLGTAPGGAVTVRDTVFVGAGSALHLSSIPRVVQMDNCLRLGRGAMVAVAGRPQARQPLAMKLMSVTCRQSGPLLHWWLGRDEGELGEIRIEAHNCVFEPVSQIVPIMELVGGAIPTNWQRAIEFAGRDSIVAERARMATWVNAQTAAITPLPETELRLEGLSSTSLNFRRPLSVEPHDAEIKSLAPGIPRLSRELPGYRQNR